MTRAVEPPASAGLRATLEGGDCSLIGTFVTIPRVELVEALGAAGYDFVILDCEHGPFGIEALTPLIAAARGSGLVAIVRTPDTSPHIIGAALDVGADGVLSPRIPDLATADAVVRATRLPPTGDRGVNPFIRAASYGLDPEYLRTENSRRAAMIMIEDHGAVAQIEQIVALEELDCIFIGPFDLSAGAGAPGELDHPKVLSAVERTLQAARERRLATGAFAATPEAAAKWMEQGVNLIALSTDSAMASNGFRDSLQRARSLFPEARSR